MAPPSRYPRTNKLSASWPLTRGSAPAPGPHWGSGPRPQSVSPAPNLPLHHWWANSYVQRCQTQFHYTDSYINISLAILAFPPANFLSFNCDLSIYNTRPVARGGLGGGRAPIKGLSPHQSTGLYRPHLSC